MLCALCILCMSRMLCVLCRLYLVDVPKSAPGYQGGQPKPLPARPGALQLRPGEALVQVGGGQWVAAVGGAPRLIYRAWPAAAAAGRLPSSFWRGAAPREREKEIHKTLFAACDWLCPPPPSPQYSCLGVPCR